MKNSHAIGRYLIPFTLTLATISPIVISPAPTVASNREARALLSKQVGAIAKSTAVRIEEAGSGGRFGSGVIVGRRERGTTNIYTVLTAAHVLRNRNSSYQVVTPRPRDNNGSQVRQNITFNPKTDIKLLAGADLALVTFKSDRTFAVATLGDSNYADEGSPVYVAGFPQEATILTRIALQFTGGMVSSRLDSESDGNKGNSDNGYNMVYTNVTRSGMSGGPVFDAAGRLVGIHGQGDRNAKMPGQEATDPDLAMTQPPKTGFNLGIPSRVFFKLYPKAQKTIGAKVDLSPVNYQLADNSATIVTPSRKFTTKNRVREALPKIDVSKVDETID
jgi:serine protease Do